MTIASLVDRKGLKVSQNQQIAALLVLGFCSLFFLGVTEASEHTPIYRTGHPKKSRLNVEVASRWMDGNGYRPVQVKVMSQGGPAASDRTLQIMVRADSAYWRRESPVVVQNVQLAKGENSVTTIVSVPQQGFLNNLQLSFSENGQVHQDLSVNLFLNSSGNYYDWTEAHPRVLFIDSDMPGEKVRQQRLARMAGGERIKAEDQTTHLPDVRRLAIDLGSHNQDVSYVNKTRAYDHEIVQQLNQLDKIEILPPAELPTAWIHYSIADLIVVSIDDLKKLQDEFPEKWDAVRSWAASGPMLCVYGLGDRYQRLPELNHLVDLSPREEVSTANCFAGFTFIDAAFKPLRGVNEETAFAQGIAAHREIGLGKLVILAEEEPFPGKNWHRLLKATSTNVDRLKWYQRHGLSLHRANSDYWKWLVQGVGLPPVTLFLVLISAFVVLIGPVNYVVLRRLRRLYLLLVTVPGGAAFVTVSLLAYAIVGDGLGVQTRVRSFTEIDQTTGTCVCWSRQSYYASIVPSSGLTFPATALVFPVHPAPSKNGSNRDRSKSINWTVDQVWSSSHLVSRTVGQFLVINAKSTLAEITIDDSDNDGVPTIQNELGTKIQTLLLRNTAGGFFVGESIDDKQNVQLQTISAADAYAMLGQRLRENRLEHEPDFNPNDYGNIYWGSGTDQNEPPVLFTTSIMESELGKLNLNKPGISRRSYIAIVDRGPEVALGIKSLKERGSFHVIRGKW
ncbi:MAG: hypothetical protein MK165_01375 [Pirellulaceae bacterium]|nr:hypothetical protein [Pirellulaceae bacterium]